MTIVSNTSPISNLAAIGQLIPTIKQIMDDLIIEARFRVKPQLYAEVLLLAGE